MAHPPHRCTTKRSTLTQSIIVGILTGVCATIAYHVTGRLVGSHRELDALPGLTMQAVLVLGLGAGTITQI